MGLQALVPTSAASFAALQLFRQDPDPVPEAATAAGAGAWGKARHGRAPGFGGSVAKVLQCRVCSEPFDDRSSCCTFCQNEMQRRGKRKQAHLADDEGANIVDRHLPHHVAIHSQKRLSHSHLTHI